jgi:hypothetical protein
MTLKYHHTLAIFARVLGTNTLEAVMCDCSAEMISEM